MSSVHRPLVGKLPPTAQQRPQDRVVADVRRTCENARPRLEKWTEFSKDAPGVAEVFEYLAHEEGVERLRLPWQRHGFDVAHDHLCNTGSGNLRWPVADLDTAVSSALAPCHGQCARASITASEFENGCPRARWQEEAEAS